MPAVDKEEDSEEEDSEEEEEEGSDDEEEEGSEEDSEEEAEWKSWVLLWTLRAEKRTSGSWTESFCVQKSMGHVCVTDTAEGELQPRVYDTRGCV